MPNHIHPSSPRETSRVNDNPDHDFTRARALSLSLSLSFFLSLSVDSKELFSRVVQHRSHFHHSFLLCPRSGIAWNPEVTADYEAFEARSRPPSFQNLSALSSPELSASCSRGYGQAACYAYYLLALDGMLMDHERHFTEGFIDSRNSTVYMA